MNANFGYFVLKGFCRKIDAFYAVVWSDKLLFTKIAHKSFIRALYYCQNISNTINYIINIFNVKAKCS